MAATKKAADGAEVFEKMMNISPESFKEGYEKIADSMTAMADFQKGSVEAIMASAGAFAKGFEKLTSEQTTFAKTAFEDGLANAKAASASGNVQEAVDLNREFVRKAIETNLGQVSKVTDIFIETAKETVEPLTDHYGELVEKVQAYRP